MRDIGEEGGVDLVHLLLPLLLHHGLSRCILFKHITPSERIEAVGHGPESDEIDQAGPPGHPWRRLDAHPDAALNLFDTVRHVADLDPEDIFSGRNAGERGLVRMAGVYPIIVPALQLVAVQGPFFIAIVKGGISYGEFVLSVLQGDLGIGAHEFGNRRILRRLHFLSMNPEPFENQGNRPSGKNQQRIQAANSLAASEEDGSVFQNTGRAFVELVAADAVLVEIVRELADRPVIFTQTVESGDPDVPLLVLLYRRNVRTRGAGNLYQSFFLRIIAQKPLRLRSYPDLSETVLLHDRRYYEPFSENLGVARIRNVHVVDSSICLVVAPELEEGIAQHQIPAPEIGHGRKNRVAYVRYSWICHKDVFESLLPLVKLIDHRAEGTCPYRPAFIHEDAAWPVREILSRYGRLST